jgi:hypothetical protein
MRSFQLITTALVTKKNVDVGLLGCVDLQRDTNGSEELAAAIFRAEIFTVNLKMDTVYSLETFVSTYKCSRRCNSEDQHRHLHRRVNLKSHIKYLVSELTLTLASV